MSLRKELKQAWDALAYADVGEFLPYAEKCRLLGVEPPGDSEGHLPPVESAPRRAVALTLSPGLEPGAIDYAIGMAQRLEAGLVLLCPAAAAPDALVRDLHQRLAAQGVSWEEVALGAPWIDSAASFLRRRGDVVCLILAARDLDWPALAATPRSARRWRFGAPVVVVDAGTPLPQPA